MEYKTYLFTYHFDGANWEIPIRAQTREEAQARINRIPYATYTGELVTTIPIPSMKSPFSLLTRAFRAFFVNTQ